VELILTLTLTATDPPPLQFSLFDRGGGQLVWQRNCSSLRCPVPADDGPGVLRIRGVGLADTFASWPLASTTLSAPTAAHLQGRIVDAVHGRPIADATIHRQLSFPPEPARWSAETLRANTSESTNTSTSGHFSFSCCPNLEQQIEISHPDYLPTTLHQVLPGEDLEVALFQPTSLQGRVTDLDGQPIAHADVYAGLVGALPVQETWVSQSDSQGFFASDEIPAALTLLSARADGFAPTKQQRDLRNQDRDSLLHLKMAPECPLAGQVLGPDGRPVAGVTLTVDCLTDQLVTGSVSTGEDGLFSMPWVADGKEYQLRLEKQGFDPLVVAPVIAPQEALVLTLLPRRSVTGRVQDTAGQAVPCFSVRRVIQSETELFEEYYWRHSRWLHFQQAEGEFTLAGLRNQPYSLWIEAPGFVPARTTLSPTVLQLPLVVTLQASSLISGQLVDAAGKPVPGAAVSLAGYLSTGRPILAPMRQTATTRGSGEFRLQGVPQQQHFDLAVTTPYGWTQWWRDCEVGDFPRVLQLAPTSSIAGQLSVLSPGHSRAIRVRALQQGSREYLETQPDCQGRFEFPRLPAGLIQIETLDEWQNTELQIMARQIRTFLLAAGEHLHVDLRRSNLQSLRGRVRAEEESLKLRVEACLSSGLLIVADVEKGGRFVLPGIGPGTWQLGLRSRTPGVFVLVEKQVVVTPGQRLSPIELDLPSGRIQGKVRLANGGPPPPGTRLQQGTQGVAVGEDGKFVLALQRGAQATLFASAPGWISSRIQVGPCTPTRELEVVLQPSRGLQLQLKAVNGSADSQPVHENGQSPLQATARQEIDR
jgi:hypothetical protein